MNNVMSASTESSNWRIVLLHFCLRFRHMLLQLSTRCTETRAKMLESRVSWSLKRGLHAATVCMNKAKRPLFRADYMGKKLSKFLGNSSKKRLVHPRWTPFFAKSICPLMLVIESLSPRCICRVTKSADPVSFNQFFLRYFKFRIENALISFVEVCSLRLSQTFIDISVAERVSNSS